MINSSVANYSNYSNKCRPQINTAFGSGELIRAAALIRVNTVLSGIAMVLSTALKKSAAFLEKKFDKRRGANSRKFGTFIYAL